MNWLKNIKIIMFLVLGVSSLYSGEGAKINPYDKLRGYVETGKFASFKKLYAERHVTVEQKQELLEMANKIIEREKANSPRNVFGKPNKFWGNITSTTGKHLRERIKILSVSRYVVLGLTFPISFEVIRSIQMLRQHILGLSNLQNGNGPIPLGTTAAITALYFSASKKYWLIEFLKSSGLAAAYAVLVYMYFWQHKIGKAYLVSYKLFKASTKIKQLLETTS